MQARHVGSLGGHPGCRGEEPLARTVGVGILLLSLMLLIFHCFLKLVRNFLWF